MSARCEICGDIEETSPDEHMASDAHQMMYRLALDLRAAWFEPGPEVPIED